MVEFDIYKVKVKGKIPNEFPLKEGIYRAYCEKQEASYNSLKDIAKETNTLQGVFGTLISYKKPYNLQINNFEGENYMLIAKNLNFLEKLIFEHHLKNFQKKKDSNND